MKLNGVDIAGYQQGINIYDLTADFVIVKVTEGIQGPIYNPDYRDMLDAVLETNRLAGAYHYANGNDAISEADSFFDAIKEYKGRIVPCLDWEGQGNHLFGSGEDVAWCKRFMDRISSLMGSTCMLYASKGHLNAYDWSSCTDYPLWGAEYASEDIVYEGYEDSPWQSNREWGAWGTNVTIHQYGFVLPRPGDGGVGALDGDVFYGTREDWQRMCVNGSPATVPTNSNVLSIPDAAAEIMWHKVNHDQHGYSQPHRSTSYDDKETITLSDGTTVDIAAWDDDCSAGVRDTYLSLGIDVGGFTYTGNEAEGLLESGNFVRVGLDDVGNGDILLRDGHTEMVVVRDGNVYQAGFRHGDYPGGLDGDTGDQDGSEATYSDYLPWTWEEAFHCTATRPGSHAGTPRQKEDEMYCLIQPNEESYLCYFDGQTLHPLGHPDEAESLQMVYMATHNGQRMPLVHLGQKTAPWATRLAAALERKGLLKK